MKAQKNGFDILKTIWYKNTFLSYWFSSFSDFTFAVSEKTGDILLEDTEKTLLAANDIINTIES